MKTNFFSQLPKTKKSADRIIFEVLLGVITIGALMIILVSLYNLIILAEIIPSFPTTTKPLSKAETALNQWYSLFTSIGFQFLIAGAASMSGAFLGFIFGIPKYVEPKGEAAKKTGPIAFSDNLVQVSDWLTKIIVGVGLTQLTQIPHHLHSIGKHIAEGGVVNANSAIAIIVYFVICGFAAGYLWTTIYYPPIMNQVYKAVTTETTDEIVKESEMQKDAMRLFNEQMSKSVGQSDISQSMLDEAIQKLNDKSKDAVFQLVDRICYENADNNKRIVKRIIPIFQAFINAGNPEQVFEYYAELGFAYMSLGEYNQAYDALSKAYSMKPAGYQNYEQLEHNLAESLIAKNTQGSTYSINDALKETILGYLKAAIKNPRIEEHMNENNPDNYIIRNWLGSIGMTLESLKST